MCSVLREKALSVKVNVFIERAFEEHLAKISVGWHDRKEKVVKKACAHAGNHVR